MVYFPPEIWQIIIDFAYKPYKRGWNLHLWQIGLVSKMHCRLVKRLFALYIKKPVVPRESKRFLSKKNIIRYITRDAPVIANGHLLQMVRNKEKGRIEFLHKNYHDEVYFYEQPEYITARYLVARSYSQLKRSKPMKYELNNKKVNMPIIIIPSINKNNIVDKVFILDKYQMQVYYRATPATIDSDTITETGRYQHGKKFDDLIFKIFMYLMNPTNLVKMEPAEAEYHFIEVVKEYHKKNK